MIRTIFRICLLAQHRHPRLPSRGLRSDTAILFAFEAVVYQASNLRLPLRSMTGLCTSRRLSRRMASLQSTFTRLFDWRRMMRKVGTFSKYLDSLCRSAVLAASLHSRYVRTPEAHTGISN